MPEPVAQFGKLIVDDESVPVDETKSCRSGKDRILINMQISCLTIFRDSWLIVLKKTKRSGYVAAKSGLYPLKIQFVIPEKVRFALHCL